MIEILINRGVIAIMSTSDLFDEFSIELEDMRWFLKHNHDMEPSDLLNESYASQKELVENYLLSNSKYRKKIKG